MDPKGDQWCPKKTNGIQKRLMVQYQIGEALGLLISKLELLRISDNLSEGLDTPYTLAQGTLISDTES